MFIDRVKVRVRAGSGGRGCVSFRREKYVPYGGPDGGDGGHGGSIFFQVQPGETTLLNLHSRPSYKADDGGHGLGKCMHGANGADIVLEVPPGTLVYDQADSSLVGELLRDGDRLLVAQGGKGGKGNTHYKTAQRQAPRRAQPGTPGEERDLLVELKLVAQGGLVGLPNAGKSTLLKRLTRAHPKIADYPFTTLHPVLGSMSLPDGTGLILADIPGIVQGAHEGVGLGLEFLRHIERTVFLIFVLDLSTSDEKWLPAAAYSALRQEIGLYKPEILQRPQFLVFNKVDLMEDESETQKLVDQTLSSLKSPIEGTFVISAETGDGVASLREALVQKAPRWLATLNRSPEEVEDP